MNDASGRIPADTLLLRARIRTSRPPLDSDTEVYVESDALVVTEPLGDDSESSRSVTLVRPLAAIDGARLSWGQTVDHAALQDALACSIPDAPAGGATLAVRLGADDFAVLERVRVRYAADVAHGIRRAATLPDFVTGLASQTAETLDPALAAYRHASLVYAWQSAFSGRASTDIEHDRDAAAVALLAALRNVL
ncbi:MAG TPA: hypothetical protein VEJ20_02350 [Candidatus Eremiobacteraceae bacterium]|nr:hypothetical protein [Candidatus Eremiobacteraceae bacterium]